MITIAEQPTTTVHRDTEVRTADVIAFIRKHGRGRVFRNWTDEQVGQWLSFYSKHGDCIVIVDKAKAVTAVMVGWRAETIERLEEPWLASDPTSNLYYIAQIIAPGRDALDALFLDWRRRYNNWLDFHLWARRNNRIVRIRARQLMRLFHFSKPSSAHAQISPQPPCVTPARSHDQRHG